MVNRNLVCAAILAAVVACGGDSFSPSGVTDGETFHLVQFNGSALPAEIRFGFDITSGTLVLHDSIFTETLVYPAHVTDLQYGNSSDHVKSDVATGFWRQLASDMIELRFTDRVPFVYDTVTVSGTQRSAHCRPYFWCDAQWPVVFER